jgi:hypothetical protein
MVVAAFEREREQKRFMGRRCSDGIRGERKSGRACV